LINLPLSISETNLAIENLEKPSINRRDFFKLKFLLMFYSYFSNFLGFNLLQSINKQKLDYSILDKLIKIDFTEDVKKEVALRVNLQKKYAFNSNGYLQTLDRVLKEIIDYVIYKNDFNDFVLLCSIKDIQIDYIYMYMRTARRGALKQLQYMQQKLLGTDKKILNEALIHAFKSKSSGTVMHFLKQNIKLDKHTKNTISKLFKKDEFNIFQKELLQITHIKFLPSPSITKNIRDKKQFSKTSITSYDDSDYFERQLSIMHNTLVDLYKQNYITDFTINLNKKTISATMWNSTGVYPIDFISIIDEFLGFNGINIEEKDIDKISEQVKFRKLNDLKYEDVFYTDTYHDIQIDII